MPDLELYQRLEVVERLTKLFRIERIVHLSVTMVSLIILLTCAVVLISSGKVGKLELTLMFGSSGLITYTAGRLLFMWTQALNVIVSGSVISSDTNTTKEVSPE